MKKHKIKRLLCDDKKNHISISWGLGLMLAFQMHQTMYRINTARIDAVHLWSLKNIDNKVIAEKYLAICESSNANAKKPTIIGCEETLESADLASVITHAVDDIRPPMPLRWLVNE